MLSRKAKYGLQAMIRLARSTRGGPLLVADLAGTERIPKKFLEQILLELKHRGLVQSKKGKGGGYMLGRPAEQISMGEIIRVLDGPLAWIPCVSQTAYMKCDVCVGETTCGVRMLMKEVHSATCSILDGHSLGDIVQAVAAAEAAVAAGTQAAALGGGTQAVATPRASVARLVRRAPEPPRPLPRRTR